MTRAKDISKILTDADFSGTLDVTGVSTLNSKVGILGTNDLGLGLHIKEGDSGVTSVSTDADQLVIENNAESGISILAPTNSASRIAFGDSDNNKIGMIYYNHTSDFMQFDVNNAERMRIANSGNLGLGTSSPAKQLHLKSATPTLRLEDSDQTSPAIPFDITVSTDNINIKEMANNRNLWYADSGGTQIFYTAGSERMRISSDGSKNFGTNTSGSGGFNLYVGSANTGSFACRFDGVGTGSSNVLQFVNGYGQVGSVTLSGASTAYNTSSDHRLKENVTSDWDATTRLKQLNPVRFNFIVDADTTVDGFLAHEVQSVVPEAISGEKDAVDADGKAVMQGIDQSKIVPLLTKTILELEARITALEGA